MKYDRSLSVGNRTIALDQPTYFIADIASNHDGDLTRARELVWAARDAGADAAKFQHFKAKHLVSGVGFENLKSSAKHQDGWGKSVFDVYEENEYQREWDSELHAECQKANIHFMTSPYDKEAIDSVEPLVAAYKIGSGDITTPEILTMIAGKPQPVFLACGASSMEDVVRAVNLILEITPRIALMQCNTNYTGTGENFRHINLNVLKTFSVLWPQMVLGLSDHTPGHSTVLGAVALGARCIEKHFTDDNNRSGPDHPFSMNPQSWREMVDRTREVEQALGDGFKRVQDNEVETVVVQRRSLHLARNLNAGDIIKDEDLQSLRPAPPECFSPYERSKIIGSRLRVSKTMGETLLRTDID
jgi:sialic acid synthase SpsE